MFFFVPLVKSSTNFLGGTLLIMDKQLQDAQTFIFILKRHRIPVEYKTPKSMPSSQEFRVSSPFIKQIYSYMSICGVGHGVLSNYEETYFFFARDDGCLLVSNAVGKDKIMETLAVFLSLPPPKWKFEHPKTLVDDSSSGNSNSSCSGSTGGDNTSGSNGGGGSEFTTLSHIISTTPPFSPLSTPPSSSTPSPPLTLPATPLGSLLTSPTKKIKITTNGRLIGAGAVGMVYEATLETDHTHHPVAFKISNISQNSRARAEFQNEISMFKYLREAQGEIIPNLLWHGYLLGDENWYGIATTLCSPEHNASEEEKREVLERLSQYGVNHEDVRDENFVRSPEGQLFIIDFGLSSLKNCEQISI